MAALAAVASQFSPEARAAKRRLLAAIADRARRRARRAPPAPRVALLSPGLPGRPRDPRPRRRPPSRLSRAHPDARAARRRRASTTPASPARRSSIPYGLPLSRWLAARLGAHADIGWAAIPDTEKIADALDLLVTPSESDAFSEGGFTVRRWLEVARAGRRLTDLQVLVEAFDRAPLESGLAGLALRESRASGPVPPGGSGGLANHGQAAGGAPGLPADCRSGAPASTSSGRRRGRCRRFAAPRRRWPGS